MCFQLCVDLLYSQVQSFLVTVSVEGKRGFFPSWERSIKLFTVLLLHGGGEVFIHKIFVQ